MFRALSLALMLGSASVASPLSAASSFALINRTGGNITSLEIRRAGTAEWRAVAATAAAGASAGVTFADPDCAFDIRVTLASGDQLTFAGVNLCDVSAVVLNRNASGSTWVDYG